MKGALLFVAIFALSLLVIPMIALGFESEVGEDALPVHSPGAAPAQSEAGAQSGSAGTAAAVDEPNEPDEDDEDADRADEGAGSPTGQAMLGVSEFRILDESTGEIHTVSVRDYVRGAVAAEMPVSFHAEALKAQAVAAHTYALQHHLAQQANPDPALRGADFAADPSNLTGYMTEASALDFWGEQGEEYWAKICAAADEVLDYVMVYDDAPIVAAYHAMSAGQTEDAGNVWVGEAEYLRPVESDGDLLAPDFEVQVTVQAETLREAVSALYPQADFSDTPNNWVGYMDRSASGYVTAIELGGVELHGKELRELLGLRSHNFDLLYNDEGFHFITYGHGHGVGLSQYGADYLARQGMGFEEILCHYYTGAALCRVVY